jgi:hypothetical protein
MPEINDKETMEMSKENLTEFQLYLAEQQAEVGKRLEKKTEQLGEILKVGYIEFIDDEIVDIAYNVIETLGVETNEFNLSVVLDYFNERYTFEEMVDRLYFGGEQE